MINEKDIKNLKFLCWKGESQKKNDEKELKMNNEFLLKRKRRILKASVVTLDPDTGMNIGRWEKEEHERFMKACYNYGDDWKKIEDEVKTRNIVQIRSHAQKYLIKLCKKFSIKLTKKKFLNKKSEHLKWNMKDNQNRGKLNIKDMNVYDRNILYIFSYYNRDFCNFESQTKKPENKLSPEDSVKAHTRDNSANKHSVINNKDDNSLVSPSGSNMTLSNDINVDHSRMNNSDMVKSVDDLNLNTSCIERGSIQNLTQTYDNLKFLYENLYVMDSFIFNLLTINMNNLLNKIDCYQMAITDFLQKMSITNNNIKYNDNTFVNNTNNNFNFAKTEILSTIIQKILEKKC